MLPIILSPVRSRNQESPHADSRGTSLPPPADSCHRAERPDGRAERMADSYYNCYPRMKKKAVLKLQESLVDKHILCQPPPPPVPSQIFKNKNFIAPSPSSGAHRVAGDNAHPSSAADTSEGSLIPPVSPCRFHRLPLGSSTLTKAQLFRYNLKPGKSGREQPQLPPYENPQLPDHATGRGGSFSERRAQLR